MFCVFYCSVNHNHFVVAPIWGQGAGVIKFWSPREIGYPGLQILRYFGP